MNSRRDFLQNLGLSGIGLTLTPGIISAQNRVSDLDKTKKILRVALMGLGNYATRVAEAMQSSERARIIGLISGTPSKLKKWQNKYHVPAENCYNYENFDEISNNRNIDAVYILTPNALHHKYTLQVAKAGKHVICEKPMAINAAEGLEMIQACRDAGVKLLVGYRLHFEANNLEVVRMRKDGELGKILFFEGLAGFTIGDPTQWRLNKDLSGGGAMMDIGIYAINAARFMIGEEPVWVTAQETKTDFVKFKDGIDETITFQLGFSGGAVASCLSTYNMNNLDRFFVNGSKGFAVLQPASGYGPIKGYSHNGEINKPHKTHQTIQMDEMASFIFEGQQPVIPVDGEEGLRDLKIIDAIYLAVKAGKKIVLG